ncbi:aladin isoform X2 [Narcine bancroftii]|uniref:aladin isoform X2 n=1 Tax=Narcine bancroftii TaxID=1343680 RepID=UPI00383127B2
MVSLALFPPPNGGTTLFELNNELVTGTPSSEDVYNFHMQVLGFPPVAIQKESLKPHCHSEHSSKAAFLSHSESVWERSANTWHESGIYGLLEEINRSAEEVPRLLRTLAGCALIAYRWITSFRRSLTPHLTLSTEDLLSEFTQVTNWKECTLRAFAWHPHTNKCALAVVDDSIRIYKSKRPSSGCGQVLSQPGHGPVTSLAWCPQGGFLVSASPMDTCMMVWDVATEISIPLQRVGGGGVSFLAWSPDGHRILATTPSAVFRVWETRTWTCDRWPTLKGRCQTGCWSPDGSCLLFTVQGESVVYLLTFVDTGEGSGASGSSKTATICADLSRATFGDAGDSISVGGEVQSMVWDPSGERLAVLLRGEPCSAPTVAVFKTRIHPVFELLPCGFVQSEDESFPQFISFHPSFAKGALLTVGWSSGQIANIPFYFVKTQSYLPGVSCSPPINCPRPCNLFSEL